MSEVSDEQLSQFLAFTGTSDPNVARQYLEMSGNNVETAVSLFMDHGSGGPAGGGGGAAGAGGGFGGGGGGEVRAPDATRSMRLLGGPDPDDRGGGGGGGGYAMGPGGAPPAALVAALGGPAAREMMGRMMMDQNGGLSMGEGAGGGMSAFGSAWAADAPPSGGGASNASSGGSGNGGAAAGGGAVDGSGSGRTSSQRNSSARDAGDSDSNDGAMDDSDDEYAYPDSDDDGDYGGASASVSAPSATASALSATSNLQAMFAPPVHLLHSAGGFMGAKNVAKDARRWLLVNIQSDSDFACHALNRDVWRDELVENLVREGFILWQAENNSAEGQTYVQRYRVSGYPHLGIVDPRTGTLLWRKEGWTQVEPLTAEQFVEIASDFCSGHSFDRMPVPARHSYSSGGGGGGAAAYGGAASAMAAGTSHKRPLQEMSEEEQLQAAIRASMGDADDRGDDMSQDDAGVDEAKPAAEGGGGDAKPAAADLESESGGPPEKKEEKEDEKSDPFSAEILALPVPDEPASDAARIQIRLPDGKRVVRKFPKESKVKEVYAFVAQRTSDEARAGRPFEMKAKFPPVDLVKFAEDTVGETGLNGEAVQVFWK